MEEQRFVARERELEQLDAFLNRALAGQGQVCFVTGEAGSGKTALVSEFARQALERHQDLVVAVGQSDAQTGAGDAHLPFREVLAQLTGDVEAKLAQRSITEENAGRLRQLLRLSGQALAEVGPDLIGIFVPGAGLATRLAAFVAEKAGWLDRLEQLTGRSRESVAAASATIEQNHIFEQYTNVLKTLAEKQPLLLVLDDLQWADTASTDLLFRLGRRIEESRILIVGTYRPAEVALGRPSAGLGQAQPDDSGQAEGHPGYVNERQPGAAVRRHPLAKVLAEFKRYFGEIQVDLDQAKESEGRHFVDAFLDTELNRLGEGFRQALYQHTGGHPLFTIELLRDMQERGDLVRDEEGHWIEGEVLDWAALPARVEGVIQKRLSRLEQDLREALTIASVEGEDFFAEVIARVQNIEKRGLIRQMNQTLERQHRLIRAQGIQRLEDRRLSRYRFQHSIFQKYLYGELDEAERGYLHEDVGIILEELYGERASEIAVRLAHHFAEAGLEEKAATYLQQAGEQAAARFANTEAIDYFSRALELTPESEIAKRFELLLAREKIYDLLGRREAQKQDLEALQGLGARLGEVLSAEKAGRLRVRSILRQGAFAEIVGEYAPAEAAVREAIALARQIKDLFLEAKGYRELGFILWRQGDYPAAQEYLERAIDIARAGGLRRLEAEGVQNLAFVLWRQGKNDQSKSYHERALTIYRDLGDRHGEATGLGNLGNVYLGQGKYEAAKQCYEESARIDREIGERRGEVMSLANLGIIANVQGDYARAYARFEQVRGIFAQIGDRAGEARALGHLGLVRGNVGDYAGARAYYNQGLQIFQEIGNRQAEGWLLNTLGLALHYQGNDETAQAFIQQALDITQESGNRSGQAYALTGLGRVQASQGDLPAAAAAFRQARDIRLELGEQHLVSESLAGLTDVLLAQGALAEALSHTEEILDHLQGGTLEGIEEPFQLHLTCYHALLANKDPRSDEILQRAYHLLQEQAAKISDLEMRRSFLKNVAAHQEIITAWERRGTSF